MNARDRIRIAAMFAVILLGGIALAIGASGEWDSAAVTRVLVGCVVAVLLLADVRPPTSGGASSSVLPPASPPAAVAAVRAGLVWFASEGAADLLGEVLT